MRTAKQDNVIICKSSRGGYDLKLSAWCPCAFHQSRHMERHPVVCRPYRLSCGEGYHFGYCLVHILSPGFSQASLKPSCLDWGKWFMGEGLIFMLTSALNEELEVSADAACDSAEDFRMSRICPAVFPRAEFTGSRSRLRG